MLSQALAALAGETNLSPSTVEKLKRVGRQIQKNKLDEAKERRADSAKASGAGLSGVRGTLEMIDREQLNGVLKVARESAVAAAKGVLGEKPVKDAAGVIKTATDAGRILEIVGPFLAGAIDRAVDSAVKKLELPKVAENYVRAVAGNIGAELRIGSNLSGKGFSVAESLAAATSQTTDLVALGERIGAPLSAEKIAEIFERLAVAEYKQRDFERAIDAQQREMYGATAEAAVQRVVPDVIARMQKMATQSGAGR